MAKSFLLKTGHSTYVTNPKLGLPSLSKPEAKRRALSNKGLDALEPMHKSSSFEDHFLQSIRKAKTKEDSLFRGTEPSLWKFWDHGVTSSFLNAFDTCREQARISYVLGYKSRHVPLAFEFGTCGHWILEMAYKPEGLKFFKAGPNRDDILTWVQFQTTAYERKWRNETTKPSQKQVEMLELVLGIAEAILPSYFQRWAGDFTGKYKYPNPTVAPAKWDSLEEVFDLPYEFPDGRVTHLRGRRDGVFLDKQGKVWVFDTKCRSVINHEDACETLPVDTQQMLYLYATYLERKKKGFKDKDAFPVGTVMNILRRPGHRRGANETLVDFLGRIAEDVSKPAKFDHNFVRYQMRVSPAEIMDWKAKQLDPYMQEVRMWWEGTLPHRMSPNALLSKYGRAELFQPILYNDFTNCYRREHAFSELAD